MNKIIISAITLASLLVASCNSGNKSEDQKPEQAATAGAGAVSFNIDTTKSKVNWLAKKVTGQHNGTIKVVSGELKTEDGKVVAGKFDIDLNSINILDLTDPAVNAKLLGHLKSDDFFSTATHPKGTFEITSVEPLTGAADGKSNALVKGNLTLMGIAKPVEFPAVIKTEGDVLTASGAVELDRTLWDIRYGSGKFFPGIGDKMIYDTFKVEFALSAVKG